MKVLVTTLGRGHFIQVASSLISAGVDAKLIQGWLVEDPERSLLLKAAAKIIGRKSMIYGFSRRTTPELRGRNIGDFWAEFWQTLVMQFCTRVIKSERGWNWGVKLGFHLHGRKAAKVLSREGYQIFHVKSGLGAGGAIAKAKSLGVKVLVDHSAGSPNFIAEHVKGRKLEKSSYWYTVQQDCDAADLLMVDCDWVKQTFLMYGYPEEKIRVVYMGLDPKFNGLRVWNEDLSGLGRSLDRELRIVFSGPFALHKGNHYFLEAIEKLLDRDVCFTVDVIGSVEIADEDRRIYSRAMDKIRFHGHVAQDRMCDIMKTAHVYLFPSLSEGCAKSAYEAMSMGLCVVCTKETGLPLRDGEDGFLIQSKNSDSIVERIRDLVEDPGCISSAGRAATETLKKYTWDFYAENVKAVYAELMEST